MDFVKREDQNVIDEENYKMYLENLQKYHQIEEYQHTQISMEQLHQAMQSSINNTIVQNFNLPLSPRQMSTLMLRTNHIARNDLPAHLRNIELDLHSLNDLQHRHEDLLTQNINRNLDLSLLRSNDIDLQAGLAQTLQNMSEDLRSDVIQNLPHDLNQELDLSHHLRQNVPDMVEDRRTPMVIQCVPDHLLDQITRMDQRIDPVGQRIDQISRIDQARSDQIGRVEHRIDQRLDQISRIDQRLVNERQLNTMPMQFHIKSEQDDEYFYDNINSGIGNVDSINGHIQTDHGQTQASIQTDNQIYSIYPPQTNIPSLNPLDMYPRTQYTQNFVRDNPQNLVLPRQYDNTSPYHDLKKTRQDGGDIPAKKQEQPKENQKPVENKIFYNESFKNDESQNKIDDLSINIKGEYVCYKCNEIFPTKRGLKQHAKICTDSEEIEKNGKFSCTQCAYRCQSLAILKVHERIHSGEKPFSCNFCDYKSGQKNNVAKHILVHMKEKPFRCQYCEYRCAQKNNLVVHERTHTGYKPFACNFCDYRTVQKPNLVKHMYLHTDQKPFSCDVCNYRCVQKTNLTKHKQRHLNEKDGIKVKDQIKPYRPRQKSVKCPNCPYRCVQKSSMEKHMQFKHGAEFSDNFESEIIQNLSVKKDDYNELVKEPLQIQS